jgi:hypothetical protein
MSKQRPPKKKVVVSTSSQKKKVKPTVSRSSRSRPGSPQAPSTLLFNKQHFLLMGLGAVLVALGLLLMSGGGMDDPNEWHPEKIYSFRRTVLAPIVILAGLGVEIYAIFK